MKPVKLDPFHVFAHVVVGVIVIMGRIVLSAISLFIPRRNP